MIQLAVALDRHPLHRRPLRLPVHQEQACDLVGGHFPETEEDARPEDLKNRVRGSLELPNFSKN